jgi:hypothetical protein
MPDRRTSGRECRHRPRRPTYLRDLRPLLTDRSRVRWEWAVQDEARWQRRRTLACDGVRPDHYSAVGDEEGRTLRTRWLSGRVAQPSGLTTGVGSRASHPLLPPILRDQPSGLKGAARRFALALRAPLTPHGRPWICAGEVMAGKRGARSLTRAIVTARAGWAN